MENDNKNINDKILDDVFSFVCDTVEDDLLNSLPNEEDIDYEFSNNFNEKQELLLKKYKADKFRSTIRINRRVAVFIFIALISIATLTLNVQAIKIRLFNFFIDQQEEFTKIHISEKTEYMNMEISYLPEGFELTEEFSDESGTRATFKSSDSYINFSVAALNTDILIDTENASFEEKEIFGVKAFISFKNDFYIYVWHKQSYVYSIISNLNQNEIEEIIKKFVNN